MEYRMELDALNAIVREQKRTNKLLEQLLARGAQKGVQAVTEQKTEVKKTGTRGNRA